MFIAVDGIDGAGKTTLVKLLARHLSDLKPLVTKEPTDKSEWGRALRDSALRSRMPRERELEFFHKDRINHLKTEIRPALDAKRIVICDRYVDSTLAFQARTPAEANKLYRRMVKDIVVPDVTLILDCPVEVGLSRIQKGRSRFSAFEDLPTLERAREIYASRSGPHYVHINASKSIDDTFRQACVQLKRRFRYLDAYLMECSSQDEDLSFEYATA